MVLDFNAYAAQGNEILDALADDLKISVDKAGRVLRALLLAMRDHINVDESLQVIARLPMAIKLVYIDQWDPWHSFRRIHNLDEFISEMQKRDKTNSGYDLKNGKLARLAVAAVFRTLHAYIPAQEFMELIAALPRELKEFINHNLKKADLKNEASF